MQPACAASVPHRSMLSPRIHLWGSSGLLNSLHEAACMLCELASQEPTLPTHVAPGLCGPAQEPARCAPSS
eukprot:1145617-Pelagomonas_calceolata.AAC.9